MSVAEESLYIYIVCVRYEFARLTNLTSAGETSSLESMTAGGWLLAGSLATGLITPLREATCELGTERGGREFLLTELHTSYTQECMHTTSVYLKTQSTVEPFYEDTSEIGHLFTHIYYSFDP